ncbi:hypothetical protein PLICRDRAFT_176644 [Plicaturopsis crispa FD-325 SS-3]|nr:hypothetical protein PLICRDRAFT_176644 [Plicaturopsis crispa FD-325 SS-3]
MQRIQNFRRLVLNNARSVPVNYEILHQGKHKVPLIPGPLATSAVPVVVPQSDPTAKRDPKDVRLPLPTIDQLRAHRKANTPLVYNPFLPFKNPKTGNWRPPQLSLRRQAELVKIARCVGKVHLLPPGPKLAPSELAQARQEATPTGTKRKAKQGVLKGTGWDRDLLWVGEVEERVKGVNSGVYSGNRRMFKGHKWERVSRKREAHTDILMRDMQKRINRFKSIYRKRRPSPLKPALSSKSQKLPF